MILQGIFADPANRLWAVVGATGIVLGAAYMLWLYQRVMLGSNDNPENQSLTDLNLRELATFIPLIILAFWIGLYPRTFLQYLHEPVNENRRDCPPGGVCTCDRTAGGEGVTWISWPGRTFSPI